MRGGLLLPHGPQQFGSLRAWHRGAQCGSVPGEEQTRRFGRGRGQGGAGRGAGLEMAPGCAWWDPGAEPLRVRGESSPCCGPCCPPQRDVALGVWSHANQEWGRWDSGQSSAWRKAQRPLISGTQAGRAGTFPADPGLSVAVSALRKTAACMSWALARAILPYPAPPRNIFGDTGPGHLP